MNTLRYTILNILALAAALLCGACDKMDDNGDFYGNWLLVDCRYVDASRADDNPLGTLPEDAVSVDTYVNTSHIDIHVDRVVTWAVRNELIMLRDLSTSGNYWFATFERNENTLRFIDVYENDGSNDKLLDLGAVPTQFCMPADGCYEIIDLSKNSMTLRTDEVVLKFKRN